MSVFGVSFFTKTKREKKRTNKNQIVNLLGKPLHLNLENKIFGLSKSTGSRDGLSMKQVQKINIIILLAKFAIVKAKAQNSTTFVLYFEEEINFCKILS